ncbi:YkyA family protein [Falsibacillus albus]|uniref:YkyA family protein n=1 Tax=Falsibacillus albus TaxID=2478915 RepID=UPI001314575C|nr:YkyA family protein [Falsibacillus albus]
MSKFRIIFLVSMVMFLLSGCFNQKTPEEEIYQNLEKTVQDEKDFQEQQQPLTELEKQEKEIFDKIMDLGMKNYNEIVSLSDEALGNLKSRREKMGKEQDSIKKSKADFEKAKPYIKRMDDKKLKKQADQLINTMEARFSAHDLLYENYINGLNADQKLYEMFKDKNLSLEDLEAQIKEINDDYKEIFKANEEFNKKTEQYNKEKVQFYQSAGIEIKK